MRSVEAARAIPQGTLARIIAGGRQEPRASTMRAVAAALNVTREWLEEGKGEPPRPTGKVPPRHGNEPDARHVTVASHETLDTRAAALLFARARGLSGSAVAAVASMPACDWTADEWLAAVIVEAARQRTG